MSGILVNGRDFELHRASLWKPCFGIYNIADKLTERNRMIVVEKIKHGDYEHAAGHAEIFMSEGGAI
ncbi:hypothetical protein DU000_03285 [Parvibium lacunae]|uniref:Uncharacterized protein n=1 Tax=Parvibium lacunae TaxID=1888893 RepID=A0A368L7U9_9BURK|nr:hypothetical protein DU000_03285 [Parvibium lacunae]